MPTQILPAASLRSADRLPAARGLLRVSNRLISIALWSIGRVIFRVASNFLPALRERRAWPHGMANPILASDMAGSEVMSHEAVRHRSAGPPRRGSALYHRSRQISRRHQPSAAGLRRHAALAPSARTDPRGRHRRPRCRTGCSRRLYRGRPRPRRARDDPLSQRRHQS
jgi:hypothetical protein